MEPQHIHTCTKRRNLYWHFAGILLGLPERKDLGSLEAPVIKLSPERTAFCICF